MKETKVYPQSEADQDFAKLLKNIRTEEKVSLDQLAMGLMSASQLVKIENGERPINKNIRDRLLERLGIAKELYENLLDLCDFEEWDYKKKILSAIQNKKIEDAYRLLKEYKQRFTRGYKRYKETSGLMEWKIGHIFHSIFT